MKKVTVWQTEDGKLFERERQAVNHEAELAMPENKAKTRNLVRQARRANDAIGDRDVRRRVDELLTDAFNIIHFSDRSQD